MTAPVGRPPLCRERVVDLVAALAAQGISDQGIVDILNQQHAPLPGGGRTWSRAHVWRLRRTRHFQQRSTDHDARRPSTRLGTSPARVTAPACST